MANGNDNQGNGNGNPPTSTPASNASFAKQAELLKAINEEYGKQIKAREKLARITKTATDPLEKQIEQQELVMNSSLEMLRILETEGGQRTKLIELKQKELDYDKARGKISLQLYEAQTAALQEMGEAGEDATKALEKGYEDAIVAADKAEKSFRKARDGMEGMKKSAEGAAGALADVVGIAGKGQSVIGNFVDGIIKAGKGGKAIDGLKKSFVSFAKELTGRFSLGNVLAFQAKNTFDIAIASNKANAAIKRQTGLSRDFVKVTQNAYLASAELYHTIEEINTATLGLSSTFVGFSHASDKTIESLGKSAATLEKFGISSQEQGQILTDLQKGFGEMGDTGMDSLTSLTEAAREFGIQPHEIGRNFTALLPQIAMFGQRSKQELLSLTKIAKATGIATGKIFNIQESFMDFEKSAQTAAGLNVAFGEQLFDPYELTKRSMEGSESLIGYIQETAQGANRDIKEMLDNPAMARFLDLNLAGDALDARKLLLGTTEVPKIKAKTMEEELAGKATSVGDKTIANVQHASDALLEVGNAAVDAADQLNNAFSKLDAVEKGLVTLTAGIASSIANLALGGGGDGGGGSGIGDAAAGVTGVAATVSLVDRFKGKAAGIVQKGKDFTQGFRGTGAAEGLKPTGNKFGAGAMKTVPGKGNRYVSVTPAMKRGLDLQKMVKPENIKELFNVKNLKKVPKGKAAAAAAIALGGYAMFGGSSEAQASTALPPASSPPPPPSMIDPLSGAIGVGATAGIGAGIGKFTGKGAMAGAKGAFKGNAALSLGLGVIEGGYEASTMDAGGATEGAERLQKFAQTTAAATVSGITFGLLDQQYLDDQMTAATKSLETSGFFDGISSFFGESSAETKAAGRQGNLEDEIAKINEEARLKRQAQQPSVAGAEGQQTLVKKMDKLLEALNSKPIEVSVNLDKKIIGRASREFIGMSLDPTRDYVG